jgi:hypothetical protein
MLGSARGGVPSSHTIQDEGGVVTGQRSRAYARVTKTLREVGSAKLLAPEQARIRRAADTLIFCADLVGSASARAVLADLSQLQDQLVASGRWNRERAAGLMDDIWACGPGVSMTLPAAV